MNTGPSVTQTLVDLAGDAEFFRTAEGTAMVALPFGSGHDVLRVSGEAFRRWLQKQYWDRYKGAPGNAALLEAQSVLEGNALFEGTERRVWVRLAAHGDAVYLDLADDKRRVVEVTRDGWQVVENVPVRFRRPQGLAALPIPAKGGDIEQLSEFLNVATEDDGRLLVAWLVGAFHPVGPYPVLVLQGEQGSAKTTTTRILRSLLDPSEAPVRSCPRTEQELMISAQNSWVLAFDNLSGLSALTSDAISRLATGSGYATRKLYTDTDEVMISASRPIILNGIPDLAVRQDLQDRSIVVELPAISDSRRRDEKGLFGDFSAVRPHLLGALLDALSCSLRNEADVQLERLPRMADFARRVVAAEEALGWEAGSFITSYSGMKEEAVLATLENDPLADAIARLVDGNGKWQGTSTALLNALAKVDPSRDTSSRSWPSTPQTLANRLKRLAPALRAAGIAFEKDRSGHQGTRLITLRRMH